MTDTGSQTPTGEGIEAGTDPDDGSTGALGPPSSSDPSAPSAPAPPPPSATARWLRRGGVLAVVVVAVAILVWGNQRSEPSLSGGASNPVVVFQQPLPGAIEPRQVDLGAELAPGFDGRLIVNGIDIPEEEMQGARDPASVSADDLAEDGLRPNNRNRVFFRPGPGKVIEALPRGEVQVTVNYFRDRSPNEDRGSISWTITVN